MRTTLLDKVEAPKLASRRTRLVRSGSIAALIVFVSAAAAIPFYFMGQTDEGQTRWTMRMPDTHDMFLHYDQMRSFYTGLSAGERYPRWEVETNRGFGAPTTCFYPPAVYYLTSAIYRVVHDWLKTLLWAHFAMMLASAAALYLYARGHMSRLGSTVASVAYAILPYHLIDQYTRGAMAEYLSFIWMPLILLSIEQIFGRGRFKFDPRELKGGSGFSRPALPPISQVLIGISGLAISYGAFAWSHPPTAFQFSMALGVLIPLYALAARNWRGLAFSAAGILLGAGASAMYLYPANAEKHMIRSEFIGESWPYHESYVLTHTKYMDEHWEFFSTINKTWVLNLVLVLGLAVVFFLVLRRAKVRAGGLGVAASLWVAAGLFASFMMTRLSYPLGRRIPMIDIGVFTWRMLGITTLAAALLAGAAAETWRLLPRQAKTPRLIGLTAVSLILTGTIAFTAVYVFKPADEKVLFTPEDEHLNDTMLPQTAPDDPEDLPTDTPAVELDGGNGTAEVRRWDPEHRVVSVDLSDDDTLWVRTFVYPGWTARVDGKPWQINTGEDLGDIELDLPAGSHSVALDFLDTPDRIKGRRITIVAMMVILGTLVAGAGAALKPRRARR